MDRKIFSSAFLLATMAAGCLMMLSCGRQFPSKGEKNLANIATPSGSSQFSNEMNFLNDGLIPNDPDVIRSGRGRRPSKLSTQWVEYEWLQPVKTDAVEVFWWDNNNAARLPHSYQIQYWDGNNYVPVKNPSGLTLINNKFNKTIFDLIETTKLRLQADSAERNLTTILELKVIQAKNTPDNPPLVLAGADRIVMHGGKTYLAGETRSVTPVKSTSWTKISGPGEVTFKDATALNTDATFSDIGEYVLSLSAIEGRLESSSSLKVKVMKPTQNERLDVVYTKTYKVNSPFWNARIKAMIVNWIPWCINQIERTDLTLGEGGLDNFIEAAKAIRGEPHDRHLGYVFSNAWVHQTIEAMSIALMVDPQGDKEIIAAQNKMKATIEKWIPLILAAQEPDGYLQTAFTLRDTTTWKKRWDPPTRSNHEGYVAGYFIESAINHYTLTEGKDKRLYDAAKKLADCWVANIGPDKKEWYDGHQEMEQALVRFGRFVNDMEGNNHGDNYIKLGKFLLDCRKDGKKYDQSHVPVHQQYEAVGHAVRASYNYSGMADVAAETGDTDYQSAVMSLWDNIVNKKYYITGGIGSGETAEGFGNEYSLPNNAYCEACSSCGLIFFQYKMNIAYNNAKYADLYEETIYNALLGSLDLDGKYFYYDNALNSSQSRYQWHTCPCCVGNIPRTLLMIPTWTYVKSNKGIYVNLYIGSTIKVEKVSGTNVEMIQKTAYPWSGKVSITVNPQQPKEFSLFLRVPNRSTSDLYSGTPVVNGINSLIVNGQTVTPEIINGYAVIKRSWKAGDKVELDLPMQIQTITPDKRIEATRGKVALRYGPLVYNVEKADNQDLDKYIGAGPLETEWNKGMLGGVMIIKGKWDDGTPLIAIPNYARNNRNSVHSTYEPGPENPDGGSIVWIKSRL